MGDDFFTIIEQALIAGSCLFLHYGFTSCLFAALSVFPEFCIHKEQHLQVF